MDLKQIKELMSSMEKTGVKKVMLKEKTGFELQIEMPDEFAPAPSHTSHHHPHPPVFVPHHPPPRSHEVTHAHPPAEEAKSSVPVEGKFITSPMVGTFYSAPSPDHPSFVRVGDRVEESTVVCIVEAMKVMNEVKAGVSGTVAEACLESGHPVEFGTKLFRIV